VQVGSIDVHHEQGSLLTTGKASDLAVQGNGFFVLSNGIRTVYTRDGSFSINARTASSIDPVDGLQGAGLPRRSAPAPSPRAP
jgi:flagellar hook protein FlgE